MKLYHTSPAEIKSINNNGLLLDSLCFSIDEYVMTAAKTYYVYSVTVTNLISVTELYDSEIVSEIAAALEINCDQAEQLLDDSASVYDFELNGEDGWWIQGKQGECAKKMGYEGVQACDEQGTVYIIPMFSREKELILERIETQ